MKNVIFIAPPAAGKGTQSSILKEKYGYNHLSTGDMLRETIASGSDFGKEVKNIIDKGNLVSDEVMIRLIKEKLAKVGEPFILDGFPRTLNQAISLDSIINSNYEVIYLDLSRECAISRIEGRLTCKCGKSYNINEDALKPKVDGICDYCGEALVKRDDDNSDAFIVRYDVFLNNTKPILDYYENKNKLHKIDVNRNVLDISNDILKVVAND